MKTDTRSYSFFTLGLLVLASCGGVGPSPDTGGQAGTTTVPVGTGGTLGQTEFVSEEPGSSSGNRADAGVGLGAGGASAATPGGADTTAGKGAVPGGRVAEVEEADIYKIDGTRLLYFNTYRGFLVFDIADPKAPKQLSRLPVFGYPIEMFVSGTTVYALLRDALYLTTVEGKPVFERQNVSQLVAIDISDPAQPRVIKTVDIIGQLREGVSRKIEDTLYVVSYLSRSYYYGWYYAPSAEAPEEQAWVYSFDVSDPANPRKVGELQIFEGGSVDYTEDNQSYYRYFSGVTISATSNALMVVENWYTYSYSSSSPYGCGSYDSNQEAVVSIIDISDPTGAIRRHTRFGTTGAVNDQFKMTYVHDAAAKTGTFFGIFARDVWSSAGCSGSSYTQNTLEAWDITDGEHPTRVGRLDFGKPNETVRGTAFDVTRKVAYAITAQQMDPLYAISIADPKNLTILSAVDGLSGDMSVFRLISDRNFLIAVGTDTSGTCTGFDSANGRQATKIAVSIIDVRDLTKVRLVQRQCVAVEGATWGTGSAITWNLDQAHKMIGMHSDATANVITVPVYYYTQGGADDWWWYNYQTAVGIMAWDLTKYDDRKDETQQTVITNHGTFIHPNGEVRRTIVFTHPVTGRRSMLNLSDTHASLADLQDLGKPEAQSVIELAPYYSEIYRFGDYLVEHVQPKASSYQEPHEFRVRSAAGGLAATPVARFTVGQVQRVIKHGTTLVLFASPTTKTMPGSTTENLALIYDLSDPAAPRRAAQVKLPSVSFPYYYYYCGWAPFMGYWFGSSNTWVDSTRGIALLSTEWDYATSYPYKVRVSLTTLDLTDPAAPGVATSTVLETDSASYYQSSFALAADAADPSGFYVTSRARIGDVTRDGYTFTQYKHFAQRFDFSGARAVAEETVNLPGPLVNTWASPMGDRLFLTQEPSYLRVASGGDYYYRSETKLALLRQVDIAGAPAAELLDARAMSGLSLSALAREGSTMIATGQPYYPYDATRTPTWQESSDRLAVFDLSNRRLDLAYDQPTKAYGLRIMGTQKGRAFLNLQGDGIVQLDISNPAAPVPIRFQRTLGYATHLESFGDDVYVASGYFGLEHMSLVEPPSILSTPQRP